MPTRFAFFLSATAAGAVVSIALILAAAIPAGPAVAKNRLSIPAPLGLTWGWNITDMKRNGITIRSNKRSKYNDGNILTIANTPQKISGTNFVTVSVSDRFGLQKVNWSSIIYRKDPAGSKGKARYFELKSVLTKKYGAPKSYEWLSRTQKHARNIQQFYTCMRISGCGAWTSYWTTGYVGSISLKMKGLSTGNGYVSLSYEGPEFSRYFNSRKNRQPNNRPQNRSNSDGKAL